MVIRVKCTNEQCAKELSAALLITPYMCPSCGAPMKQTETAKSERLTYRSTPSRPIAKPRPKKRLNARPRRRDGGR